jgi:lysophospholipase L1-like esterase
MRARHRRLLFATVTLLLAILLIDAAAGIIFSLAGFADRQKKSLFLNDPLAFSKLFIADPLLFWRLRPETALSEEGIRVNRLGLRGAEIEADKTPGVFRVLCLGDSVTFGFKVRDAESYPARLQVLLRIDRPVEVLNAGVPGYSSLQGARYLKRDLLRLKSDLIVVGFGRNDRWDAVTLPDSRIPTYSPAVFAARNWLWRWNTVRLLATLFTHDAAPTTGKRVSRCSPAETAANFAEILRLARSAGARVVFFCPLQDGTPDMRLPNFHLANDLPQIEVNRSFADLTHGRSGLFFADHDHPTSEGGEFLARAIAAELKARGYWPAGN